MDEKKNIFWKYCKWPFGIEAERHLIRNPLFWTAASFPLVVFCMISIPIWKEVCCEFDFSSSGYLGFSELFKFPIAILGLSFSLLVLVVAHHRSMQSVRAMQLQDSQNKFVNYLNHIKFFEERFEGGGADELRFFPGKEEVAHIYGKLFPLAKTGDFSVVPFVEEYLDALKMFRRTSFPVHMAPFSLLGRISIICSLVFRILGHESYRTLVSIAESDLRRFLLLGLEVVSIAIRHSGCDDELVLVAMKREMPKINDSDLPSECSGLVSQLMEGDSVWITFVPSVVVPVAKSGNWDDLKEALFLLQDLELSLGAGKRGKLSRESVLKMRDVMQQASEFANRYK